ncbi:MAG: hypothetical protein KME26_20620 [Oscillatoria princeps RMCB-10]|jgi:hypothetical protein|nr:hypothetical protein [Oscillatoria princeps RMCB-10]
MRTLRRFKYGCFLAAVTAVSAIPALAEKPIFGKLSLAPGFPPSAAAVTGYTSGSTSLPAIVANRDRHGNPCLGFADSAPDLVLVLEKDFPRLRVQVDSKRKDTTLAIIGPGGVVRCGDDTGKNKDASIEDSDWKAGPYSVWVGSIEPGPSVDYKLTVVQP